MGSKQLAQLAGRVNRHLEAAKQDSKACHEHADAVRNSGTDALAAGRHLKAARKHYKSVRQHIDAVRKAVREFERAMLGR